MLTDMDDDATAVETTTTEAGPAAPPLPYTDAARLRLMLSWAFHDAADDALSGVGTYGDRRAEPGAHLEHALRLLRDAEDVVIAALAVERIADTTWEEIAEVCGVTKQTAHRKYAADVAAYIEKLQARTIWRADGMPDPKDHELPWPYRDPEDVVKHLDRWLCNPRSASVDRDNPRPVSSHLPRHSVGTLLGPVAAARRALLDLQLVPDPQRMAECFELEADLYERHNAEHPDTTSIETADLRAQAAQLRATEGHGITWKDGLPVVPGVDLESPELSTLLGPRLPVDE